ncbi:MAG TPA: DUF2314 domain-containing protein [Planctomycetota bacterium]|jgi:uncharacterized protein YegJ (DUF2314 family)
MALDDDDPEVQAIAAKARETLPHFEALHARLAKHSDAYSCFKFLLEDGEYIAHVWVRFLTRDAKSYTGVIFEIPHEFKRFKVGTRVQVPREMIEDWMINDDGTMYGAFSLRYQRSHLPKNRRATFDRFVGITCFADNTPTG